MTQLPIKWLLAAWLSLALLACNSIHDIQPVDANNALLKATQAIKRSYPQATDIRFQTLIEDKLWQASFTQNMSSYQTQVNSTGITSSVFKELANNFTTYQRLTDQLTISGGAFASLCSVEGDTSSIRLMTYSLQGIKYQLIYEPQTAKQPRITLNPLPIYYLNSTEDLPQSVQAFFTSSGSSLRFQSGTVIQQPDGQLSYWIKASYAGGQSPSDPPLSLFFNADGRLVWTAGNDQNNPVAYTANNQVGDSSILAAQAAKYPGFDDNLPLAFETYYQGLVSVRYAFQRVTATRSERWDVGVNWPGGQLVYSLYQAN